MLLNSLQCFKLFLRLTKNTTDNPFIYIIAYCKSLIQVAQIIYLKINKSFPFFPYLSLFILRAFIWYTSFQCQRISWFMALYDWNQFGLTCFFQCIALLFVTLRVDTNTTNQIMNMILPSYCKIVFDWNFIQITLFVIWYFVFIKHFQMNNSYPITLNMTYEKFNDHEMRLGCIKNNEDNLKVLWSE